MPSSFLATRTRTYLCCLTSEQISHSLYKLEERLRSTVVQYIFVHAGSIQPTEFLQDLLVIGGSGDGGGDDIGFEDPADHLLVFPAESVEATVTTFISGDRMGFGPAAS